MKPISGRFIAAMLALAFQQAAFSAESISNPIRLGAGAIAGILKNCDAIREARKESPKFEIRKDHLGRPGTIVANNGFEYVV